MANKKFYYRNKTRLQKTEDNSPVANYTAEQLSRALKDLSISEATCALLEKNRISTAGDLVRRTDKDLFRVQGFNKKMLFEVKDALRDVSMQLRSDAQDEGKPAAEQSRSSKEQKEPLQQHSSKFGLADRRADGKQKQPQQPAKQVSQKPARPEKLTEPLSVENWRKVMKGGKWGFSDGFKIVVPTMYDEVFCFKEGLASVEIDGKCGFIDSENNIVIPFVYDTAMSFSEGLAMVVNGEKCGYINKENEVVIPFSYDAATPFEGGEAKVKKEGKWATLTPDNKLVWI